MQLPILDLSNMPKREDWGTLRFYILKLVLLVSIVSVLIPLVYTLPKANIENKKIGFVYQQYNPDSPIFLYSSLGFPTYYNKHSLRSSRPFPAVVTKLFSSTLEAIAQKIAPKSRMANQKWGQYLVLEHFVHYFGWLLLNVACLFGLLYFTSEIVLCFGYSKDIKLILFLIAFSSPVILTLTWLHSYHFGWLLNTLSIAVVMRMHGERPYRMLSLLMGVLLLGKFNVVVPAIVWLLFFKPSLLWKYMQMIILFVVPTILWRLYAAFYGIEINTPELGDMLERIFYAGSSYWGLFTVKFFYENVIGFLFMTSPYFLYLMFREFQIKLLRLNWMIYPLLGLSLLITFFFFAGRTGSLYLFETWCVMSVLFMACVQVKVKENVKYSVKVLYLSHFIWQLGVIYFQLLLWRNGLWF